MALTTFPPPIFAGGFVFLRRLPTRTPRGGLYIGFLVQPRQSEIKTDDIGATRLKRAYVAWPGARAPWSCLALVGPLACFFFSC
jgi:hypothetical protein